MDFTDFTAFLQDRGVPDLGPIDETSPDLDPIEPPREPVYRFTVRYSERFAGQVRDLGGIEAAAALVAHHGPPTSRASR